ncbi:hypothetical protein BAE44_0022659, partial [Dichanthelium oligosanthes]
LSVAAGPTSSSAMPAAAWPPRRSRCKTPRESPASSSTATTTLPCRGFIAPSRRYDAVAWSAALASWPSTRASQVPAAPPGSRGVVVSQACLAAKRRQGRVS